MEEREEKSVSRCAVDRHPVIPSEALILRQGALAPTAGGALQGALGCYRVLKPPKSLQVSRGPRRVYCGPVAVSRLSGASRMPLTIYACAIMPAAVRSLGGLPPLGALLFSLFKLAPQSAAHPDPVFAAASETQHRGNWKAPLHKKLFPPDQREQSPIRSAGSRPGVFALKL